MTCIVLKNYCPEGVKLGIGFWSFFKICLKNVLYHLKLILDLAICDFHLPFQKMIWLENSYFFLLYITLFFWILPDESHFGVHNCCHILYGIWFSNGTCSLRIVQAENLDYSPYKDQENKYRQERQIGSCSVIIWGGKIYSGRNEAWNRRNRNTSLFYTCRLSSGPYFSSFLNFFPYFFILASTVLLFMPPKGVI